MPDNVLRRYASNLVKSALASALIVRDDFNREHELTSDDALNLMPMSMRSMIIMLKKARQGPTWLGAAARRASSATEAGNETLCLSLEAARIAEYERREAIKSRKADAPVS